MSGRVAVVGEVVQDLIQQPSGDYRPHLGGSPFNVALALARQDQAVRFLSPLSTDAAGPRFRRALIEAGADPVLASSDRPTSLALVTVDDRGQPDYVLYREGIADLDITAAALIRATPDDAMVAHTGSLMLTPAAVDRVLPWLTAMRARGVVTSVDLNLRPKAVPDLAAYRRAVLSVLPLCDLVKCSDEDLRALGRSETPAEAARWLLSQLPDSGGLVVVTAGGTGCVVANRRGAFSVPAAPVAEVIDTVGAGDCFQAGLLAGLASSGMLRQGALSLAPEDALRPIVDRARVTAALNVQAAGCQPPTLQAVRSALAALGSAPRR